MALPLRGSEVATSVPLSFLKDLSEEFANRDAMPMKDAKNSRARGDSGP
jgi:hypothetical protein